MAQQTRLANLIATPAPASIIVNTGSPAVDNSLYPTPGESVAQMPNPNQKLDTVESVTVSALVASGAVLLDPAGFEPFKLTIQAAVEALNGLAAAVDELLTPGVGYRWEDLGVGSALLRLDPNEALGLLWHFIDTPAEVHRDDAGNYVVSTRFGRDNPDPVVIASLRDMESAKYVAAQAVRDFNAATDVLPAAAPAARRPACSYPADAPGESV